MTTVRPTLAACVQEFLVAAAQVDSAEAGSALFARFGEPGPEVAAVEDLVVNDAFRVRLYRPAVGVPLGLHVVFHGGGWVSGSIDEDVVDAACRERAVAAGVVVASVDYRLAPEFPFPTPLEDCYAALTHLVDRAEELGIDASRVSLGGGSAGGNLAAAVAILCRERGGPALLFQLLEVPAVELDPDSIPDRLFEDAVDLSREDVVLAMSSYAAGDDPLGSPLRADLHGLPPAHVMTAGLDPLREQGEAYAAKLQAAGVPTTVTRVEGALHGSGFLTKEWDVARAWRAEVLEVLCRVHR